MPVSPVVRQAYATFQHFVVQLLTISSYQVVYRSQRLRWCFFVSVADRRRHEARWRRDAVRTSYLKPISLKCFRHRGQRDYKCVCCDFYGYTFTDIRKHQERKHAGLVHSVVCNVCGGTFKSEQMLQVSRRATACVLIASSN